MSLESATRRRFLIAVIAASGAAASALNLTLIRDASAWAEAAAGTDPQSTDFLARLARLYYPHDYVADDVYRQTADSILSAASSDEQLKGLLNLAAAELDVAANQPFVELDPASQLAVMKKLQGEAFFTAIQFQIIPRFYAHPEVWKAINYPGSSVEHGGYVERGFDDIDWLPEAEQ